MAALISSDFLKLVLAGILVLITLLIGQEIYRGFQRIAAAFR